MSLETQIAALVAAANNLTGTVNGKVSEIDAALVAAGVTYNAQLNDLKNRMPRLLVTRNLVMQDADSNGMPDSWGYHASVSLAKLRTVSQMSQATGRPAEDIALLAEIEADVREVYPDFDIRKYEYYRQNFTAWQMSWSQGAVGDYLAFPYAADFDASYGVSSVPLNSYLTVGGFVKLVSGDVNWSWATGRQLGKWRWCSHVIESAKAFGSYANLHPGRYSAEGVVRVALAGACTGVISHPSEWFAQLSLS